MRACLVSLNGMPDLALGDAVMVVGRHRKCEIRLDSSRVSRRHCCLAVIGGEIVVRDLGSTNGTFLNGLPIEVGVLRPGDVLAIAHLRYRLAVACPEGAAAEAAPAAANGALPTTLDTLQLDAPGAPGSSHLRDG